ncbi:hypothetical protein Acsp06_29650 [Actinomycetospora sp. NBRC 106375]|uniref:DUF6790 family protein n=1 Tax=Actinomycetospora sp. NBRC 106375 TaxID=3032207 RepID=UPI0024A1FD73|nr:DUF6790 family protein [Actinomycetospora sp. NBRC 106375]GLZ46780.1 hypothetical protein Acsp06_29650 [Actinomycetospora sp. NBRC 106375]
MTSILFLVLGNFTVTFLIVGLIASGISLARRPRPLTARLVIEDLFAYFLLFSVGISFLYNFAFHVFAGEFAATLIGWADSPFQAEVGYASLGFGLVGLCAFRASLGVRGVAVLGPSCFLLGAAVGHIVEIVGSNNLSPGNAGAILYTDIGLPIIGAALWLAQRHLERTTAAATSGVPVPAST